jgi:hypothetical protein
VGIERQVVDRRKFNAGASYCHNLRQIDFEAAMQDVYDFLFDVNSHLALRGLPRLDDTLRQAIMSGMLSDMLTASMAKHSRNLVVNRFHNGHPDLVVGGMYPGDSVKSGSDGVEIKTTLKKGGAVDTHGARDQWMCVFVYSVDRTTEPAIDRAALKFTEIYLSAVTIADFTARDRNTAIGTRTANIAGEGLARFRENWIYKDLMPTRPGTRSLRRSPAPAKAALRSRSEAADSQPRP